VADNDTNQQQMNRANKDIERASTLIDNPVMHALGMAASAAILRKATRTRSFSKMTERTLKVMNALKNDGYSKELEDMSFKEMRNYFSDIQKHVSLARVNEKKIRLADGPHTLFGVLRNRAQEEEGARKLAQENVINRFIQQEKTSFDQWASQQAVETVSRVERENFHAFIANVAKDPQNMLRHRGTQENRGWMDGWKRKKSNEIIANLQRKIAYDGNSSESKAFFAAVTKEEQRIRKGLKDIADQDLGTLKGWKKTFGEYAENTWADKAAQKFLPGKSRAMTMKEIWHSALRNEFDDRFLIAGKKNQTSFQNEIKRMMHEYKKTWSKEDFEELLNMRVDSTLRIDAEGAYSSTSGQEIKKQFYGAVANSLPGKILKFRELHNNMVRPYTIFASHLDEDRYRRAYMGAIGEQDSDIIVRGNQYFALASDGTARNITEKLAEKGIELNMVSTRHGFQHDVMDALAGNQKYQESDNFIKDWLQIRTDREKYDGSGFHNISTIFSKDEDPNFRGNRVRRILHPSYEEEADYEELMKAPSWSTDEETESMRKMRHRIEDYNKLDEIFRTNTYALTGDILRAMEEALPKSKDNERALKIIELLRSTETGDEKLDKIADPHGDYRIKGGYLAPLMSRLLKNSDNREDMGQIVNQLTWRQRIAVEGSLGSLVETNYVNEHMGIDEIVQKDLSAELLYTIGATQNKNKQLEIDYNKINAFVDDVSKKLSTNDADELNKLAQYYIGRDHVMQDISGSKLGPEGIELKTERIHDLGSGEEEWQERYRKTADEVTQAEISSFERTGNEEESFYSNQHSYEWTFSRKAIVPMDIIKNINDSKKALALTKGLFAQFTAGSDNLQNVTTATQIPLFIMKRLSNDLNEALGIGLDGRSFTSNQRAFANIFTKRILPIALAYEYGDWANDTIQAATGTSPIGAMANGVANVDLAIRKTTGILGMDDWINQEKSINPIMQYIGGHDDYNNYEQRKRYYQEGYTPVRKARGWTFGGVGEIRGGEIQYFAPTFARRINSDYKDKSLYSSYWDKWSHSWLPTPTNPLSPIFAFLDPYHLEEEHADDRPYAVSGKMFEEDTPWGVILNPTVGAILKPQKELHAGRFRNGIDGKSLIHNINLSIKQWARNLTDSNDILVNGQDFTPVDYNNYNAPTDDTKVGTIIVNGKNGSTSAISGVYGAPSGTGGTGGIGATGTGAGGGYGIGGFGQNVQAGFNKLQGKNAARELLRAGKYNHLSLKDAIRETLLAPGETVVHNGDVIVNNKGELGTYSQSLRGTDDLHLDEKAAVAAHSDNPLIAAIGKGIGEFSEAFDPKQLIGQANEGIKARAAQQKADVPYTVDGEDGFTSPEKLSHMRPSNAMKLLQDPDTVTQLVNAGKGNDFVRNATASWRLIGGIYGYIGSEAFGVGSYDDKLLATSRDMDSYTRGFWDMNLGGIGGDVADIIHRFIPDSKRGRRVNPLMNNMPDWMPERYRYGDPYTAVPMGEARMPGKGYESLNKLHPDQFGEYGAFDRMKILADIAPFSPEYRMWKQIATKTITDPELVQEMDEIRDRVRQQGKHHDFYDYKVLGHGLNYQNVTVSEVLGYGRFRSGDRIYKVAGISVKSRPGMSMEDTLGQYLHPGMDITIATDTNDSYVQNKDSVSSTNAAVFIDGESLAQQMIEAGDAKKRKGDTTAPAILATMSPMQKFIAGTSEFVAHLDIPWLSDQYLRVRSPLESYKAEQDYGTPYQSWEHPFNTMLRPAIERAIYTRSYATYIENFAYRAFQENRDKISKDAFHAIQVTHFLTNRASFAAAATAKLVDDRLVNKFDRKFNTAVGLAHFMTGGNDYMDEMSYGAVMGFDIARRMENPKGKIGKAMAIGAAAGAAMRYIKGNDGPYMPERTKQKWDVEDYFDRLTYMKYMGLYEEAARMAEKHDGVDIKNVIAQAEKKAQITEARIKKYQNMKEKLDMSNQGQKDPEKIILDKILTSKINALSAEPAKLMDGSKWAMSALIYKQAAESTMQGLNTHSSWSQIITALPTNDREYFMEFVKERDNDKRRRILEYVSPQLRKALNLAWGKVREDKSDKDKLEENKQYFRHHYLPSEEWVGWTPDVDLKNVQIRTIANEGMNLSDFGFYESSLRDPQVAASPVVNYRRGSAGDVSQKIKRVLTGKGLKNVNVDVTARSSLDYSTVKADIKTFISGRDQQKRIERSMKDGN